MADAVPMVCRGGTTRRGVLGLGALGALAALTAVSAARARGTPPPELLAELPGARLQGSGRLRFLGLAIYDIRLWTAQPLVADMLAQRPLALELEYARALDGQRIADRSLDEMRRIGDIAPAQAERWLGAMRQLFPDVKPGDRLLGMHRPAQGARFFHNGRFLGEVADADFAGLFFGIWLSPRTSEPALRASLLGAPES